MPNTRANIEEENSLFNFRLEVLSFIKTGSLRRIIHALMPVVSMLLTASVIK
jgi:hypothetical protein